MKKNGKSLFILALLMAVLMTACQPAPAAPTTAPAAPTTAPAAEQPAHKVAILFPGVVTDQSWNQWGYEGLKKAEQDCGVEVAFSENVSQDAQVETMRNYASQGYDIILGHGGEFTDSAFTVAKEFPDIEFAISNGVKAGENVSGLKISYRQMGYLAGVLAAYMTETNYLGMVVGEPIAISEEGFEGFTAGAQAAGETLGKDIKTKMVSTGNWADVSKAREAGLALISEGIDVLFHVLDTADAGLMTAASDEGVYAIGLYRDSSNLGPNAVIGSALGSPTSQVHILACGDSEFLSGQALSLDVNAPDGVDIHMTSLVPADVQTKVKEVVAKVKSGEIVVEP